MDLISSLLTFTMFWKLSSSRLQCYSCEKCPKDFLYDDKYLKTCLNSTMCYKRVVSLEFPGRPPTETARRGCAAQTLEGEQIKVRGKDGRGHWIEPHTIYEVYEESCVDDPNNSERSTKTLLCYCRGDKCNSAATLDNKFIALITIAITLLLLN